MNKRDFLSYSCAAALSTTLLNRFSMPAFARASDDFAGLDATAQSELFKSGKVSASELVEAAIRRIEIYDGRLNSVVIKAYEQARAQAEKAKPEDGAFAGTPYLLKCLMAKKGELNSWASRSRAFETAAASDPVVAAFEKTGAIYLGQSNSPEYGSIGSTESNLYGRARNPFDLARGPAGSSGGSAVAVAAGLVPIATADDGGGSIRMPAATCGLVGLKCSRAREVGHEESLLVNTGCVSRSVRDTATVIDAIERKDNADLPAIGLVEGPSKKRLKVAYTTIGVKSDTQTHADVAEGTKAAAKLLESLGHNVEEARFDVSGDEFWHHFWALWSVWLAGILDEAKKKAGRELDDRDFEPWTRAVGALIGTKYTMEDVDKALGYFTGLSEKHRAFLQKYDIALTPVASEPPQLHGTQDPRVSDFDVMAKVITDYVNFTALHNATGLPSLSLPIAWAKSGLPLGTLFSADFGQEAKLLHLAYELEEAAPWANRRPPHGAF